MNLPAIDPARIDRNWHAITAELDAPVAGRLERLVRRIGFPPRITRVALATPGLRRAWFVAVGVVMLLAVIGSDSSGGVEDLLGFLVIAPLIPVLGVSFAYGIEADPSHEVAVATPMRGLALVLTRTSMILTVSAILLTASALLNPGTGWWSIAWLVPSIALTFSALALSTWFTPRRSAIAVTAAWIVLILVVRGASDDPLVAFNRFGQAIALVLASASVAVAWRRRDRFDVLAVRA